MKDGGLSKIVREMSIVLSVPIVIFGLYVISHGHLTPGGGFPGGAILATLIALLLVGFGKDVRENINERLFFMAESAALIGFALLAFLGISSSFFHNFLSGAGGPFGNAVAHGINPGFLGTGGTIPLMNLAVGLEVFSALSLIVILIWGGGDD